MNTAVVRRYWPLAASGMALAVLTILFPTIERGQRDGSLRPGVLSEERRSSSSTSMTALTAGASSTTASTVTVGSLTTTGARQASASGGSPAIAAPSSARVARSGVLCAPGVLQVPWSVYAPPCLGAFHGDNGGSTSHGVTGDTITLSYRRSNSTQDAALAAMAGDAVPGTDDQIIADLRAYIDLFNRSYELYGRHVVLRDFQGQGDWIAEDGGRGQPQASADAATAHDLGAFADVTLYLKSSFLYWPALAQQGVITFAPIGPPLSTFEQYSPYAYGSVVPADTTADHFWTPLLCRRMAGMPAIFAGDPAMQQRDRAFGFITPDTPWYVNGGDELVSALAGCGVKFAKRASYALNPAEAESETTSIVAQMRSAGVTTVVCWCDPVSPVLFSQAADQQQYRPEWIEPDWPEPPARLYSRQQWQHALSLGHQWTPKARRESYLAFKLASGGREPAEQYYDYLYEGLLQLFSGLQAAGPNLNPVAFQRGLRSLPNSAPGEWGAWGYSPNGFAPFRDNALTWWNPDATSGFDGKRGAWQTCASGTWFPFDDPMALGAPHNQLHCFGR
jgi:Periplasmic binding protein